MQSYRVTGYGVAGDKAMSQGAKDWLKGEALLERQSSASPLRAGAALQMGIATQGAGTECTAKGAKILP